MIRYEEAPDIREMARDIVEKLDMNHIDFERVIFLRSFGSGSKNTIARCHALPRVWQKGLNIRAHYIIEVISENFDSMEEDEKVEILIHELMHILKSFGGGFRHHKPYVTRRKVKRMFEKYKKSRLESVI